MEVLYVVGSCLSKNTSANMSHNAYVKGMLENGCNVDIIMENDSWGEEDKNLKKFDECSYYEYNSVSFSDKIRRKFSHSTQPTKSFDQDSVDVGSMKTRMNIKQKLRNTAKKLFYLIFKSDSIYPINKTWLKNAKNFSSKKEYDLVVSNSSPAASHKLVELLINNNRIECKRWVQIWEDPWYYDIYGDLSEEVKAEEHRLLKAAQEIYYVSPLTLMYQKRYFSDCADKMKCIPLPFFDYTEDVKSKISSADISFGYFGDYYSHARNLIPFYDAISELGLQCNIYGDSDLDFKPTEKIIVSGRTTLDKLAIVQENTSVLVNLCNLKGGQIPGKIYHYSATTKPILFILDGTEEEIKEIYGFFSKYNRYYFCNNNIEDIKKAILMIETDINSGKKYHIVEDFNPKNVAKLFLCSI